MPFPLTLLKHIHRSLPWLGLWARRLATQANPVSDELPVGIRIYKQMQEEAGAIAKKEVEIGLSKVEYQMTAVRQEIGVLRQDVGKLDTRLTRVEERLAAVERGQAQLAVDMHKELRINLGVIIGTFFTVSAGAVGMNQYLTQRQQERAASEHSRLSH